MEKKLIQSMNMPHGRAKLSNGDIWYNKNYYGEIV